jgi:hypothetical protein
MICWRSVLQKHDINVLHNSFEQCGGNAGAMKLKTFDISHVELRLEANKWGDFVVLDFRKKDIHATFYGGDSNSNEFHKSKENGQTGHDPLQQADIEIMRLHDMEEGDFNRVITCHSREQQCPKSIGGMYY